MGDSPISILSDRHGHLRLDDSVDPADLVGDFPSALEEQGLVNGAYHVGRCRRSERIEDVRVRSWCWTPVWMCGMKKAMGP